jgi:aspartyl-tRNA(Asn)/glutamyl-tRNA(Gln) amidotransferase subunit C
VPDRISADDAAHVAVLARLALSGDELARYTEQLAGVLDHFADIDALALDGVEPMTQPYPLTNVLLEGTSSATASTATRSSPRRRRPRTAASACRSSSGTAHERRRAGGRRAQR